MTMLAERIDAVIGVDTHKASHTAAVVTPTGGATAHLTVPSDAVGAKRVLAFARRRAPEREEAQNSVSVRRRETDGAGVSLRPPTEQHGPTVRAGRLRPRERRRPRRHSHGRRRQHSSRLLGVHVRERVATRRRAEPGADTDHDQGVRAQVRLGHTRGAVQRRSREHHGQRGDDRRRSGGGHRARGGDTGAHDEPRARVVRGGAPAVEATVAVGRGGVVGRRTT